MEASERQDIAEQVAAFNGSDQNEVWRNILPFSQLQKYGVALSFARLIEVAGDLGLDPTSPEALDQAYTHALRHDLALALG